MKRIAIVVQRCHAGIAGGSEALAWQYAQLLSTSYEVELVTSCALDYATWDNALPAGIEHRDGIMIRRFATARPRGRTFTELHRRLLAEHMATKSLCWRTSLAEEFVRFQGPWCPALTGHLAERHGDYAAVIGCTYLYATTYFGLDAVPAAKRLLVPTLHDEPPAYLDAYAAMARGCAEILWLTEAERTLGRRLWQLDRGEVVGMAVDALAPAAPERRASPYLLYCGRIDESKGLGDLLAAFARVRREQPVELVLTGSDHLGLGAHDGLSFLGFVDAARKAGLMAGCAAFVMPSPYESFSIVTLEAMAQATPVIVNGRCAVLAEHVTRSGGGDTYDGADDLARALRAALERDAHARDALGAPGRAYVQAHYAREAVQARLLAAVGRIASRTGSN